MFKMTYKRAITQMQKIAIIAVVLVVIIAAVAGAYYAGVFTPSGPTSNVKNPDTVIIETYNPIANLDPITLTLASESFVAWNVFDNVLSMRDNQPGGVTPNPGLAESWTVAADGMTYTFKIRSNAKFSNGDTLDATAVVYNINRLLTVNSPNSMYLFEGIISKGCARAVDSTTVEIKTNIKFPPWATLLTLWHGMLNPAVIEAHGGVQNDTVNTDIATNQPYAGLYSGPYKIIEFVPGTGGYVKLEANAYYWGPQPKTKYVYISWTTEVSTRVLKLKAGDADWLWNFERTSIADLVGAENVTIDKTGLSWTQAYITFSGRDPLGMDANGIKTRQALCYSYPYDTVIQYVWAGYAQRAIGPIPAGVPGAYDAWTPKYQTNLTTAAELLDQAGHTPGQDGIRLRLELDVGIGQEARKQAAIIWQSELSKIGVELSVREFIGQQLSTRMRQNQTDLTISGWFPDYPDPYHFAYSIVHSYSVWGIYGSYWKVPEIDDAIVATLDEPNNTRRYELYKPILEMLAENPNRIYLVQEDALFIHRSWLKGYVYNPIHHGMLWYLYKG
jgi:ABC-type transport system substrate-binding protein